MFTSQRLHISEVHFQRRKGQGQASELTGKLDSCIRLSSVFAPSIIQMLFTWFRQRPNVDLQRVDYENLMSEASREYLLPAMANQIRVAGLEYSLPPEVVNVFRMAEDLNGERNRAILTEAIHAVKTLNQIGIEPVALKGLAYLLAGAYSNPASRFLADIDLLIPAEQLSAAVAHLRQHGYFENDRDPLVHFRHHLAGIRRPALPHIELHHKVGVGICDRLLPAAEILAHARPMCVDGAIFLIPSPTHLVNHLILHSQLAHPYDNRIFPPLRAFVDLTQIQSHFTSQIDWSAIEKTYRAAGESATLALHLQHSNHLLGTNFAVTNLPRLRWYRRLLLNRYPALRFLDPVYLLMSLFSRRLRLLPQILVHPSTWPKVLRTLTRRAFYRNLFA